MTISATLYTYFKNVVSILIPTLVLGFVTLTIIKPLTMDWLAREDNIVETISAAALLLASAFAMAFAIYSIVKRQSALFIGAVLFIALVFFVIGMEEISWMQRILAIESSEFFMQNNLQKEMNLHNLDTKTTELVYYIGAFIMLTLLPLLHTPIKKAFNKNKLLRKLTPLLPSNWLFVPSVAIAGISTTNPVMALFTLIALILVIHSLAWPANADPKETLRVPLTIFALMCIVVTYLTFRFIDYGAFGLRGWVGTEYRELFIALGILAYTCDVIFRSVMTRIKS